MSNSYKVVELARSWLGKKESDKSYMTIIDLYNSQKKFPRGVKMDPSWPWCACTWSALAIQLGYTDVMPVEISCSELIKLAKKMGIWVENDGYIPKPGDAILYDWDDNGKGDNIGNPDHVGVVERVAQSTGYFVVIEGNYGNAVKRRTVSINGKYIRGFITPKYTDRSTVIYDATNKATGTLSQVAHEVITGLWGDFPARKQLLEQAGWTYKDVQNRVNEILNTVSKDSTKSSVVATCNPALIDKSIAGKYKTTANLYCRNDAGKNKKALCLIPKGTTVTCSGGRTGNWYLIEAEVDGICYEGFSHNEYLKKA